MVTGFTKWMLFFLALLGWNRCFGEEIYNVCGDVPFRAPNLACWFWWDRDFEPEGYKSHVDLLASTLKPEIFTASMRVNLKEVSDQNVIEQIRKATEYARGKGIGVAMDLDVRMARKAFQAAHPDEMQEMLCIREAGASTQGKATLHIESQDLNDHYTGRTTHYIPLSSRLVRCYTYHRTAEGIDPNSIQAVSAGDVTLVTATAKAIEVQLNTPLEGPDARFCVLVAFRHFAADVFGPHLLEFQRSILQKYAGMGLAGACKDEWGFPPCFDGCPKKDDYWYSEAMAAAYSTHTSGRDLLRDIPLMTFGEVGRERERLAAINSFNELVRERNAACEADFYQAVKEILGKEALVATHPTWYPFPGVQEFKKNGLDWWAAPRDVAQTDEITPFCVRTSLAKKWNSPVCINMYYSPKPEDYHRELWTTALIGGRINLHPPYPLPEGVSFIQAQTELMNPAYCLGEQRVRLLNSISTTPLDCPVAVIFGEVCALNWAGPAYADVGMGLADALWKVGYPADLIPTYEIESGALKVDEAGYLCYGKQRYQAAVLYHPEMSKSCVGDLFRKVGDSGKTALYHIGKWSMDFNAKDNEGGALLPRGMQLFEGTAQAVPTITGKLREMGLAPQTLATEQLGGFGYESACPPKHGRNRMADGTVVIIAGEQSPSGDPIQETLDIHGHPVEVEAAGVVGVRLTKEGSLEALAAGGLKRFSGGGIKINLEQPIDLAVWKGGDGVFHGVVAEDPANLPEELLAVTKEWKGCNPND
jgi:hypothetical protein